MGRCCRGRLIARASAGAAVQTSPKTRGSGQTAGFKTQVNPQTPRPRARPGSIHRYCCPRPGRALLPACAAVIHSSRCRRDTPRRHAVRTTASIKVAAVSASNARLTAIWPRAVKTSAQSAAKWLLGVTPRRAGITPNGNGKRRGSASIDSVRAVHIRACGRGSIQPAASDNRAIGASSDRRKLSIIFQRPTADTPPMPPPRRPKIQGRSCQSPRAQRC